VEQACEELSQEFRDEQHRLQGLAHRSVQTEVKQCEERCEALLTALKEGSEQVETRCLVKLDLAHADLSEQIQTLAKRVAGESCSEAVVLELLQGASLGVRKECHDLCSKVQREQSDLQMETYESRREAEEDLTRLRGEVEKLQQAWEARGGGGGGGGSGGTPPPQDNNRVGSSVSPNATSPSVDTAGGGELSLISLKAYVDEQLAASAEDMAAVAEDVLEACTVEIQSKVKQVIQGDLDNLIGRLKRVEAAASASAGAGV